MNKVTIQGVTIGTVCTAIAALFMFIFHTSLNPAVVSFLPVIVAFVAHYLGINFATMRAVKKEINKDQPS